MQGNNPLDQTAPAPVLRCRMCDFDHAPGTPACPQSRVGTIVANKYKLTRMLGSGGFGAAYAAENVPLGKAVAIKMLHARVASRTDIVARFRREARAVAALHHEGFTQIHALETASTGELVIEMELLAGAPGDTIAHRTPQPTIDEVVRILGAALDALAVAHEAKLVHRDLKPENLFVCTDGKVKLLDFGIAYAGDEARLTETGELFGTPTYASPEQLLDTSKADARSDVYSMGATAYELLTGKPPVAGASVSEIIARVVAGKVARHPAELRPEIPAWLDAWVARALDSDATARFESARQMRAALAPPAKPTTPGAPTPAPPSIKPTNSALAVPPVATQPARSRRGLVVGIAAAIAVVGVVTVLLVTHRDSDPTSSAPPPPGPSGSAVATSHPPPPVDAMTIDTAVAVTAEPLVVDLTVLKGTLALAPGATVRAGDTIAFQVKTSAAAHVYLVQRMGDDLAMLFPDERIAVHNPISPQTPMRLPATGGFKLEDDGVYGKITINVIASPEPLPDLEQVLRSVNGQRGKVLAERIKVASSKLAELGDAPSGGRLGGKVERGRFTLPEGADRQTVSVRYTQRPSDRFVVASFEFEQVK